MDKLPTFPIDVDATPRAWAAYANQPMQGALTRSLIPDLHRFVQARLPEYMVPTTFVLLDAMPLTPAGKLDRRALPAPDTARPTRQEPYVIPRTPTEELIAGVWAQLLGVERVGAYDNFFALGGHSLLAIRVLARLREALGLELPLRSIFESPTVVGLAQLIQDGHSGYDGDQSPPIVRLSRQAHVATLLPGGVLSPIGRANNLHGGVGEGMSGA